MLLNKRNLYKNKNSILIPPNSVNFVYMFPNPKYVLVTEITRSRYRDFVSVSIITFIIIIMFYLGKKNTKKILKESLFLLVLCPLANLKYWSDTDKTSSNVFNIKSFNVIYDL